MYSNIIWVKQEKALVLLKGLETMSYSCMRFRKLEKHIALTMTH